MEGELENALRLESENSEGYGTGTHSFSSSNQFRVILELRLVRTCDFYGS